jgi:hypothetical protein
MKNAIIKLILLILAFQICVSAQKTKSANLLSQTNAVFHNLNNNLVPLFVFTYINPRRNVYGSDSPEFVLYDDGTLIFTKCREKYNPYSCYYQMAKLTSEEISQVMGRLQPQAFYSFAEHYSTSRKVVVSDLIERVFVMRRPDGTYKKVSTYGALSGNETGYVAENVPGKLKQIDEFVTSYDNANPVKFYFEYNEIAIKPYGNDSKKNLKWSKDLPDLNDSKTIKHKKHGRYSLFAKRSLMKKIDEFTYKQWKSEAAIVINNQRWKAEIRIPFPSEEIWLGNFRDKKLSAEQINRREGETTFLMSVLN